MIRKCTEEDFEQIFLIINEASQVYKGIIPEDRWKEPYMSKEELAKEISAGVDFWGYLEDTDLIGVMGIQHVKDVTLIRHAYVQTAFRGKGIGSQLLLFLRGQTTRPILMGTWATAVWAIRFYQKHGFKLVDDEEKNILLKKYWSIPERQVETSVVLAEKGCHGSCG